MERECSSDIKRLMQLVPCPTSGLFYGKRCSALVKNPTEAEEKGMMFTSSLFLQFEISVSGELSSIVFRKDKDFNDLQEYLMVKYPNSLIPCISQVQQMKKFTDEYKEERKFYLTRFLNYCLSSD